MNWPSIFCWQMPRFLPLICSSILTPKLMRAGLLRTPLSLCLFLLCSFSLGRAQAADAPKTTPLPLYDISADGSKQIAEALAVASGSNKNVLLQFGANWCPWCHKLHKFFEADAGIADLLKGDFIVVLIDVNKGRNGDVVSRYGNPTRLGLPVLVVLDAAGKQLTTEDTGLLEEGQSYNRDKVIAFLKDGAPKR